MAVRLEACPSCSRHALRLASYRGLGFAAIGAYALVSAAGMMDCTSSSTSPVFLGDPNPASFALPRDVPASCTGQVYWEDAPSTLCPSGPTYYLCDGSIYSQYDCSNPGTGWADARGNPDASSSATSTTSSSECTTSCPCTEYGPGCGLPPCSGQTYFVKAMNPLSCDGGKTWFLCSDGAYRTYDCFDPGPGWTLETMFADPEASGGSTGSAVQTSGSSGTSSASATQTSGSSRSTSTGSSGSALSTGSTGSQHASTGASSTRGDAGS